MVGPGNLLIINSVTSFAKSFVNSAISSSKDVVWSSDYFASFANFVSSSVTKTSSSRGSAKSSNNDKFITTDIASSKTLNWIRGEIASRRQAATNASEAISMLQIFDEAASSINGKLTQMAELAEEGAGSSQTYTEVEKAAMQAQFTTLAGEINDIVDSTESGGNKMLSANGQTVLVSIGNGSVIRIFPRDLSIDVEGLDLSIAPGGPGLAVVEAAIEQTSNYRGYLDNKIERLEEISTSVDFGIASITGIESNLEKALTMNKAADTVKQIIEETTVFLQAQANVMPEATLQLLTD